MKRLICLKKRLIALGFILGWGANILGAGFALAQSPADWADLNDRINGLEGRIINMQRGLNRSPQDQVRENIPAKTSAALSLRINSLESQLRHLTGQVEDLNFRMRRVNDQLKRFSKDADLRFRDIEKAGPRPGVSPSPVRRSELPPQRLETGRRQAVRPQQFVPEHANPPRMIGPRRPSSRIKIIDPGANSSLKKAAPPTSLGQIPFDALDPSQNTAAIDPNSGLNRPFVDEAGALYEKAYESYLKRKFATAESSFRGFLRRYPRHELAGQAQYWLGETFYARNKYRKSARAFLIGYRKFPKNRRAPETLLKLAMSLRKLGEKAQSCATLEKLAREYPKATSGVKKTAAAERRRGGC